MREYYKILGVDPSATDEEVKSAYKILKEKYQKERFLEGEAGNEAARNLTRLENAYAEIMEARNFNTYESKVQDFSEVVNYIKSGQLNLAQEKLDGFSDRTAEWHYLQSVIYYKKNWINESKKQLEIAMEMDPDNGKYKDAYLKFNMRNSYQNQFNSGNATYQNVNDRQMGGDACSTMADCCTTWCCIQLLCNNGCR